MSRFNSSKDKLIELKKKKKTLSDEINDTIFDDVDHNNNNYYDDDGYGAVEDYDFDEGSESDSGNETRKEIGTSTSSSKYKTTTSSSLKRSRSELHHNNNNTNNNNSKMLRRRGPLHESLQSGKYEGKAIDDLDAYFNPNKKSSIADMYGKEEDDEDEDDEDDFDADEMEDYNGANIDSKMDSIFGTLDMNDDFDGEGDEEFSLGDEADEDDDDRGKKKKKKSVKNLTEEEYAAYIEEKEKKRRKNPFYASMKSGASSSLADPKHISDAENEILNQLNEIRESRMQLLQGVSAAGEEHDNNDDDTDGPTKRGAAGRDSGHANQSRETVQNYLKYYGQLLKVRVKLQPALALAIQLPQYYARDFFIDPEAGEDGEEEEENNENDEDLFTKNEALEDQYKQMTKQCKSLLKEMYYSYYTNQTKDNNKNKKDHSLKKKKLENETITYQHIQQFHSQAISHANDALKYWGDKLLFIGGNRNNNNKDAGLKTIGQSLPVQIENIIASNRSRLLQKTQKNQAHLRIYGHPLHFRAACAEANALHNNMDSNKQQLEEAKAARALQIVEGDVDEEIYNDGEFLWQLIHHTAADKAQHTQALLQEESLRAPKALKKKKFSKGKVVNYEPRPKLVSYMMAVPDMEAAGRSEVLIRSLFQ